MAHLPNDHTVATTTSILNRLFPPPRPFSVQLWNQTTLPGTGHADFRLVLNHPGALRRMLRPPLELSLGEAFIYNDFDIEGDITAAVQLMESLFVRQFSTRELWDLVRQLRLLPRSAAGYGYSNQIKGTLHSPDRDQAAIQYHYDVGNDFYALWLDRNLQYSCAYFHTGTEDLDTAQQQKMSHICRKLRLQPDERLLDIGCGWGGLALHAAQHYGVRVLGITLSANQVAHANEQIAQLGLKNRISIELRDYRDPDLGTFDKIVSVGMFEHVGHNKLPGYFAQAYRLLEPGGLFLNHGISIRAPVKFIMDHTNVRIRRKSVIQKLVERFILGDGAFIQRLVFPDGEVMPVSMVNVLAEQAGFEVRDVENLREHYALTLRRWVQRLEACRDEAIRVSNETTYRLWRLYMAGVTYGFEHGTNNVYQTLLARLTDGRSPLPLTRADLYQSQERVPPL